MDRANSIGADAGSEDPRPQVWILQFSEDGTSTNIQSFEYVRNAWPHVDIRMAVHSPFDVDDRQPFSGAREHDPATNLGSWGHYSFHELAQRASVRNFHTLGEHMDAHNQLIFFMDQINQFKLEQARSGRADSEDKGYCVSKADCFLKFAMASFITHSSARQLEVNQLQYGLYERFGCCHRFASCLRNPPTCKHHCCKKRAAGNELPGATRKKKKSSVNKCAHGERKCLTKPPTCKHACCHRRDEVKDIVHGDEMLAFAQIVTHLTAQVGPPCSNCTQQNIRCTHRMQQATVIDLTEDMDATI